MLELLLLSPEGWASILEGSAAVETHFSRKPADGFCEMYGTGDITQSYFAKLLAPGAANPWLHGFIVLHQESQLIIGGCGFKGPPDKDGVVEIGYGITPAFEGKGHATASARLLIAFAAKHPEVRTVMAHTLPTESASTRVLTKCGFTKVGEEIDPDDGLVWRWELAHSSVLG
ncbi:GNAT family N-acetyltransferase [Limnoglobus roseus]|uniref:N-acetyltransferase n=1 Tax=Limnoglobus roseus TaxID=2598579 RepID=A0A5C1A5X2_9BACT|nr:GNAT family N-acetyltransferase [Limnoglobus roseus]QEL14511.1 N-acetyltransferase [Limnoglobus roseus]